MRDVRRQRVRQWTGALVLALPFVVVTALEATAHLATVQRSEQILQPAGCNVVVLAPQHNQERDKDAGQPVLPTGDRRGRRSS